MPFKDFDAALQEARGDKLEFVVGGQTFTARAKLPWKKYSNLIISLFDADTTTQDGVAKTEEFFNLALTKKDRERFLALLDSDGDDDDDEDAIVDPKQISQILDWMLNLYTGKANKNETPSSDSQPDTGLPSNVISLEKASL